LAEESAPVRAARRYADGETQYLLGDWLHAAILISDAVEDPTFRAGREYPTAVFRLADALRRHGACGSARVRYDEYLALGAREFRGEALTGAIECAVKERRSDVLDALLAEADRTFAGNPPPEVRYLGAKAIFQRTDLASGERHERAMAAFAAVPAPYEHQAAYFQGVLLVEKGDLTGAVERFGACEAKPARDARQREVQELCAIALGRVHAELGHGPEALDAYQRVPRESPHFNDALYEIAWSYVKAKQYEPALRIASLIADLAPDSPLAPEATVLQGHLLLKLGRYAAATEAYSRVINSYAPVRDELDAILTMHEDPVRYFNELIGRQGKAFDVATVLPPVAVKLASTQKEIAVALELVSALDGSRRDVDEAYAIAERIDALLARGGGLDAFPTLQQASATAQAIQNATALLAGVAATAAIDAGAGALGPDARAELGRVHAARLALEKRLAGLPRTQEEVLARLARMRARIDGVGREAYRLGYQVEGASAAITGTELWLERRRAEISGDAEGRQELSDELRKHREAIAGYEDELRSVRQEIALARDAAAGAQALDEEAKLRGEYLGLLAREWGLVGGVREGLGAGELARIDRARTLADRLANAQTQSRAVAERVGADASRRAGELRARVALEKQAVSSQVEALDAVQLETKNMVGQIAYRSFSEVRAQFYKLVLKADLGLVDVAWARKRVRIERIQQLSAQKASELQQLDDDYRDLLREVD
jgi:tetratricopeptide (TPR) repeat protein